MPLTQQASTHFFIISRNAGSKIHQKQVDSFY